MYNNFASSDDFSMIVDLEPGNYILWIYVDYESIKSDKSFKYTLSIRSLYNFNVEYIGLDEQFLLIQQLILDYYKIIRNNNVDSARNFFIGKSNDFSKAGLSTFLIYNKSNKWLEIKLTIKK